MLRVRQTINCSMTILASNNDVLQVGEPPLSLFFYVQHMGYWESVHLVNLRHSHGGTGEGFFHSALLASLASCSESQAQRSQG